MFNIPNISYDEMVNGTPAINPDDVLASVLKYNGQQAYDEGVEALAVWKRTGIDPHNQREAASLAADLDEE